MWDEGGACLTFVFCWCSGSRATGLCCWIVVEPCGAESLREVRKQPASRLGTIQTSSPTAGLVPAVMLVGKNSNSSCSLPAEGASMPCLRKPGALSNFYFGGFGSSSFLSAVAMHQSLNRAAIGGFYLSNWCELV